MSEPFRRPRRWWVLAVYALVMGLSQLLWLNFAPLLTLVQQRYGVSELLASGLVLVFPLLYVLVSLPAGALTDRRGYRFAVGLGAVLMAAASAVRIADGWFWALMAGQVGIAIAQPFVVNGVSKLVSDWFDPQQGALATGLSTMGMFLGMAVGMASTPPLVEALTLRGAMVFFTAVAAVLAGLCLWVVRPNEQAPVHEVPSDTEGVGTVAKDRHLWLMYALAFLGLGEFNGLTTWLEQILAPRGIGAEQAGLVGGVLILGGIVGAVALPAASDALKRRKPVLLLCVAAALATVYPVCSLSKLSALLVVGGLHGFFFLPAFALLLEMTSQLAGAKLAGAATSVLMLLGNAGGVVVIVLMPLLKQGEDYARAVWLLVGLLALATVLATRTKETALLTARGSTGSPR